MDRLEFFDCRASQRADFQGETRISSILSVSSPYGKAGEAEVARPVRSQGLCAGVQWASTGRQLRDDGSRN
jgi:hypothetical protein